MSEITICHVHIKKDDSHHYFGSISAIYEVFTTEQIGASKAYLWTYGISPDNPYSNKQCVIRRDVLIRKNRSNK